MLPVVLLLATWDLVTIIAHAADILPPPGQPTRVGTIGSFEIIGQSLVSAQQVRISSRLLLCALLNLSSYFLGRRTRSTLLTRLKIIPHKLMAIQRGLLVRTPNFRSIVAPGLSEALCGRVDG